MYVNQVNQAHHYKGTHMSRFVEILNRHEQELSMESFKHMLPDMTTLLEAEASCELYGLLKRPDEKCVTEYAYEHPKFVEDMVRDVAARLNAEPRIVDYVIESENFGSIHNHSAYALVTPARSE